MSRKDFRLIAETIKSLRFPVAPEVNRKIVAHQFANALKYTNPLFDRERFLTASGYWTEPNAEREVA